MTLTPEQKATVATWVAAGDNLSAVQKKLIEHFQVTLTYRDVRFLVDDLNLALKDPAPKIDISDVTKATVPVRPAAEKPAEKKGFLDKAKEKLGLGKNDSAPGAEESADEAALEDEAMPVSNVRVSVDKASLIPGAIASGSVVFSDGVSGQWMVDQQGRPSFTKVSQDGYRPTPADAQAFMAELSAVFQQRGY